MGTAFTPATIEPLTIGTAGAARASSEPGASDGCAANATRDRLALVKNIAAILALMLAAGVITYVATQKDDAVGQATATTVATTTTIPKTEPRVFEWLAEQGWTCAEPADWEVEGMACSLSGGPVIVTAQYGLVRLFVYGEGGAFHRSTPGDSVATMIDAGRLFGWDAATAARMFETARLDGVQREGDISWTVSNRVLAVTVG